MAHKILFLQTLLFLADLVHSQGVPRLRIGVVFPLTGIVNEGGDESRSIITPSYLVNALTTIATLFAMNNEVDIPPRLVGLNESFNCNFNVEISVMDTVSEFSLQLLQLEHLRSTSLAGVGEPFDIVIGPIRSSSSIPLSFVTSTSQTVILSPGSTSPLLDDGSVHRYFGRSIPSDRVAAASLKRFLEVLPTGPRTPAGLTDEELSVYASGYSEVVVIYQEDAYGSGYKDSIVDAFSQNNLIRPILIPFEQGSASSEAVRSAIEAAAATQLNIFICITLSEDLFNIVNYAIADGIMGEGKLWIFSDGVNSAEDVRSTVETGCSQTENCDLNNLLSAVNNSIMLRASGTIRSDPEAINGFDTFMADIANNEQYLDLVSRLFPGGANSNEAAEIANVPFNVSFTPELINLFLANGVGEYTAFSFFAYDNILAVRHALDNLFQDECPDNNNFEFSGAALTTVLRSSNFSFEGITGRVEFESSTGSRSEETSSFSAVVLSFTETSYAQSPIAIFSDATWDFIDDNVVFNGGRSTAPRFTDAPDSISTNSIPEAVRLAGYSLAGVGIGLSVFSMMFMFIFGDSEIIRMGQPTFLNFALVGIMITFSGVFFYDRDTGYSEAENNLRCNLPLGLFSFGLTVTYSSLFQKSKRLEGAWKMEQEKHQGQEPFDDTSSPTESYFSILGMVVANGIGLALIIYFAPRTYESEVISTDEFGQVTEQYFTCQAPSGVGVLGYALMAAFHLGVYLILLYNAYRVRQAADNFKEVWLPIAVFGQMQLFMLGIPVVIAIGSEESAVEFIVVTLLVFLSNLILLVLIYWVKFVKAFDSRSDDPASSAIVLLNESIEDISPPTNRPLSNIF